VKEVREREKGLLLLDAGDLFFKKFHVPHPENEREGLEERASLILKSLERIGYHAIGIGDDDLTLGKKFLVDLSKRSRIPFLSSNLVDQDSNQPLFQRSVVQEVNGLRVGIFSLLAPEVFTGPSDPRRSGLIFRDPVETAQEMVNELGSQTDFIILLSHLGYQQDVDLAFKTSGIHMIVGGHTGVHLNNPPVIKKTIILQTSSKGMYAQKLNLIFSNRETPFYNMATKYTYERNLTQARQRLSSATASEAEKRQWQETVKNIENTLKQFAEKNPFTMSSFPLAEAVKDDPDIKKWVEDYKSKFPEKSEPRIYDSRPPPKP
jgi:2',3'-cyclic-nucleotide 2'-phosphodiesterase (5'-nucleotidase family)